MKRSKCFTRCAVCGVSWDVSTVRCFKAPSCDGRRRRWEESCGVILENSSHVCEQHFKPADFIDCPVQTSVFKKARLFPSAVPMPLEAQHSVGAQALYTNVRPLYVNAQTQTELPNDEKLIELVRPNQILYDKQCQGYNDDYTKVQLWMKIAEQLSSNAEESAKRWKYLHGRYIRELKRLVVEGKTEVTVEWPLFQRLTFLRKYVKQRNPYPSTTSPVEFSFVSTAMQNSDSLSREDSYISDMCNPFYEISNGGMLVPKEEVNSCGQDVALPKCVSTTENTLTKDAVAPSEGAAAKQTTAIQSFGQTVAVFISEISKPKQAKAMRVLFDALITIKMEPEDT